MPPGFLAAAVLVRRVICWQQTTASSLDVVMGSDYELATPPISASGNERYRAFGHAAHLHRAELPHAQHHACGAVSAGRVHGCGGTHSGGPHGRRARAAWS